MGLNYFLFYVLHKIKFTRNWQSHEHSHFDTVTFLETHHISVLLGNVQFHYNDFFVLFCYYTLEYVETLLVNIQEVVLHTSEHELCVS